MIDMKFWHNCTKRLSTINTLRHGVRERRWLRFQLSTTGVEG